MIAWLPGFLQAPEDLAPLARALRGGAFTGPRAAPEDRTLDWRAVPGAPAPAARVAALRACLGEACVWVGYSLGARAALACAAATPEEARPRALVLISGSAGLEHARDRQQRRALDDERAEALLRDPGAFIDAWGALELFAPLRRHAAFQHLQTQRKARADAAWARDWARVLRDWSPGELPSARAGLPSLDLPTLCVAGALDEPYVAHAKALAEALPRGRFACIPGAGHSLPLEAPDALATLLRDFMHAEGIDP